MARWFLQVMYELGGGRAVANACRERDDIARVDAAIGALEMRLAARPVAVAPARAA